MLFSFAVSVKSQVPVWIGMEEDTAAHTEALLTNVSSLEYAVSGDQVPVRVISVRLFLSRLLSLGKISRAELKTESSVI